MSAFLEAAWFLGWILTVIGVLRWFHNASEFDDYIDSAEGRKMCQMLALKTGAPETSTESQAS